MDIYHISYTHYLFGGRKIPELMKGVGSGIKEFNKAKNDVTDQLRDGMNEKPKSEKVEDKKAE